MSIPRNIRARRRRLGSIASLALAAALAVAYLLSPSAASAASYNVFPCRAGSPTPLLFEEVNGPNFDANDECTAAGRIVLRSTNVGSTTFRNRAQWRLEAPPQTEIREVEMDLTFPGAWATTSLAWTVYAAAFKLETAGETETGHAVPQPIENAIYTIGPDFGPGVFKEGTKSFEVVLECSILFDPCPRSAEVQSVTQGMRVALGDKIVAIVSGVGGSLITPGPVKGTPQVAVTGSDTGSGVFFSEALIEGQRAGFQLAADNGGKCREPFTALVPCSPTSSFSYPVDTTAFSDGSHDVQIKVCDATSANCGLRVFGINVQNAPVNKTAPAISDTAKLGVPLTATPGTWDAVSSASFSFQWLRCSAAVTNPTQCAPIPGAVGPIYTPVAADLGMREIVKVTDTLDAAGHASSSAFSAASAIVADAKPTSTERPSLSGVAKIGGRLTTANGKWDNGPTAFAYQWLRCPPNTGLGSETGCAPIAGATQAQYAPVAEDIGRRAVAKVTATNAFGPGSTLSEPSDPIADANGSTTPDTTPPSLSGVSLSRKRFHVGRGATAISAAAAAARGTLLRFSSSESGKLSIAITRVRAGKKSKAAKPLATLTRAIKAGPGKVPLSGRIKKKKMAPGRYQLAVTASDAAGNTSKPARLSLTILPG